MRVLPLSCLALALASMTPLSHAQERPAWMQDGRAVAIYVAWDGGTKQ